ncbi:hypothetical protein V1478_014786 [Vespula squamosa]|uniref:Uncharacterized protein n=1 Tax=Vespula squamosa TaxID=30214 RepID=A0ABD2A3A6_VESSQ
MTFSMISNSLWITRNKKKEIESLLKTSSVRKMNTIPFEVTFLKLILKSTYFILRVFVRSNFHMVSTH